MYSFIHDYLLEQGFKVNKETKSIYYIKYLSETINERGHRFSYNVIVNKNLITLFQIFENHKKDTESRSIVFRCIYINSITELRFLFENNLFSDHLLR
ncbi:hypothetical protein MPF19_18440 [Polaribacter sp. Z014]|uniref:hypothetical protein n=1 Tax=Polaribacter sp. Z014 TaxID=2927126 RepID=UPI002020F6CE|nr:hypothetical protein [Polaribacter sp. Z014]MCL7765403.1 hypothetical protein [Polaribacter sp. Z014]